MPQPKKKFATLRKWNRRRNYLLKSLRMSIAKYLWDYRLRRPFELQKIKKILLLRDDGKIGDMIVSTSLLREFHNHGYSIDVFATPENIIAVKNNPYIRKIYLTNDKKITNVLSEENYDVIIDMGDKISPSSLHFLRRISPRNVIGFNKEEYNIYNKSISFHAYEKHISTRYAVLMKEFGFTEFSVKYDLHIPGEIHSQVSHFLHSLPGKYNIIINPFTASEKRDLSLVQLQTLVDEIAKKFNDINIILIGLPERIKNISVKNVYIPPVLSLDYAMSLIYHANLIISPDTSVVHIAAAWEKPLISLYGNDKHGKFNNNKVWGPGYSESIQITTADEYQTISSIPVSDILNGVTKYLKKED